MATKTDDLRTEAFLTDPQRWQQWSKHLAQRRNPIAPWRLIPSRHGSPLQWGLSASVLPAGSRELLDKLDRWMGQKKLRAAKVTQWLDPWLATVEGRPADAVLALECLGWAYLLPRLSTVLSAAAWSDLLVCLVRLASAEEPGDLGEDLAKQILIGELPLVLAYQFPELRECRRLRTPGCRTLKTGIKELLDGNGLPQCRNLPVLRPLLACWTRSSYLARAAGKDLFGSKTRLKYEWLVRQALQLTRQDGSQVFSRDEAGPIEDELFDAALLLIDDPVDRAISDQVLPWRKSQRSRSQRETFFPDSADHSEWARIAILRPTWLRGGPKLVVTYDGTAMDTELTCGGAVVWSGRWETQIAVGQSQREPVKDWQDLCWHSDDDVDYLEVQLELDGGWRLQRQFVMAREDLFLYTADALLGPEAAEIDYTSCLPLASDIDYLPEPETCEGYLVGKRPLARVLPLVLPEWRSPGGGGSLERTAAGLVSQRTITDRRLYWPLFIDLNRQRLKFPVTWRHLTVAEQRQIVPASQAACYRVQAGVDQWLLYRSLVPPAARSFLGQHVCHEFLASRFDCEGEADELIAINPEP